MRACALALIVVWATAARANPGATTSEVLREGNTAALAGDWRHVARLVDPLLLRPLAPSDLSEAHRLAGIAAFFAQRNRDAESHFLAYLRIDLDGRLDSALYPPDVVAFFNDVASRHAAELRALRTRPKERSWWLTLLPPFGQFQNGDRAKGYVIGGVLGTFLAVNLTTYFFLRSWCEHTDGSAGGGLTCNDGKNAKLAPQVRPYNIASGIGVIATYLFGVYDGVQGYRRSREPAIRPMVNTSNEGSVFGISGKF
jgi:hypothetical protein